MRACMKVSCAPTRPSNARGNTPTRVCSRARGDGLPVAHRTNQNICTQQQRDSSAGARSAWLADTTRVQAYRAMTAWSSSAPRCPMKARTSLSPPQSPSPSTASCSLPIRCTTSGRFMFLTRATSTLKTGPCRAVQERRLALPVPMYVSKPADIYSVAKEAFVCPKPVAAGIARSCSMYWHANECRSRTSPEKRNAPIDNVANSRCQKKNPRESGGHDALRRCFRPSPAAPLSTP